MRRSWLAIVIVIAAMGPAAADAGAPASTPTAKEIREPAVADQFYPGSAKALREAVRRFLQDAPPPAATRPVAIVVPHAGYAFSGEIAAEGWRYASARAPELVVILGTNHTVAGFNGAAISPASGFRTPLGVVEVDRETAEAIIRADPEVVFDARPHEREHSIEVQIPFVQVLFPAAKILPLVVGAPDLGLCNRLGQALARVLRGRNVLIVASSDLSHYPAVRDAEAVDRKVLAAIASFDPAGVRSVIHAQMSRGVNSLVTCACGEAPILAAMTAAKELGATRGTVLRYGNSAESPLGDEDRVVGYGALAFVSGPGGVDIHALDPQAPPPTNGLLDAQAKSALLAYARETLVRFMETQTTPSARRLPPAAALRRGAFVTLNEHGQLRGCIGQIVPERTLGTTVGRMALAAALSDDRFQPVAKEELPSIEIEISVLSPTKPVAVNDIVVGRDGVVLAKEGRRAVFLPQVATEQRWGRGEMLDHLCQKADLPRDCWHEGAVFEAFQADVFGEAKQP
jgi:AmmeMemoRadiSam system protein B/AmmeMemoRadiSam system protein A